MYEEWLEKIVQYIRTNRVSTTEVADCLGKTGVIEGVYAMNSGMFQAGRIRYIYGCQESNWPIHEQARDIRPGEIVVIDGIKVNKRALVGEVVTKFITLYRGAVAVVVLGNVRDANDIIKQKYPVWAQGVNPVGCFNTQVTADEETKRIVAQQKAYYDGAVGVCDDTGVVVIPRDQITEEFYGKLEFMEEQEDKWFECIDRLKWDTFDTICLKKYKEDR
ncbi:MAG: RraA family protein [Anaerotruncus sp.]|nr:RraA family protein [Anaerotruncus sp.]